MAKVALNIHDLTRAERLSKAQVALNAHGLPVESNGQPPAGEAEPPPAEALELFAAVKEGRELEQEKADAIANLARINTRLGESGKRIEKGYGALGGVVEKQSGGVASEIERRGYDTKAAPVRHYELPQVTNMHVARGDGEGRADLNFGSVDGAKTYPIRATNDPAGVTGWYLFDTSNRSFYHAMNLTPGIWWFQACAKGARNIQGPWSDKVQIKIA
ncbi:MAG: hypothetical protein HZC54_21215 [Verrucomicrobia bacterium]|nr:hypothetical protein [Verrucomicrobiota bacterium]